MTALLILAIAVALCGLVVWFGPTIAEGIIPTLSLAQQQNLPLLETIFSLVIFGGLLIFALLGGAATGINPLDPGRKPVRMAAVGILLGIVGVVVAATYAGINGTLLKGEGLPPNVPILLWGAVLILFQTATEESYFRGWLQPLLAARWGAAVAVVLAALAFAALHVMGGARSPMTLANLFLGGLLFGFLASYGNGISGAVAAHFAWNATEQILLGLDPNPGLGSFGALFDYDLRGSTMWGGSDEGLNASIAMTLALAAIIVPILMLARSRRAKVADPVPQA